MKNLNIIIILILLFLCQATNIYVYSLDRHSIELENKVLNYISAIDSLYVWFSQLKIDANPITPQQLYEILNNKTYVLNIIEKMYEDPVIVIFTGGAIIRILKLYGAGSPYIDEEDITRMIKAIAINVAGYNSLFNNSKIISKFINNLFGINIANYSINDIREYTELILNLGIRRNISKTFLLEIITRLIILAQTVKNGYIKRDVLNFIVNDTGFRYSIITALFISDVIDKNNIKIISSNDNIQLYKIVMEVQNIDIGKLYKIVDLAITQLKKSSNEAIYTYQSLDIEILDIINHLLKEANITEQNFNVLANESIDLSNISHSNSIQDTTGLQDSRNYIDRMPSLKYPMYYYVEYYENDNIGISDIDINLKNIFSSKVNKSNLTSSKQIDLSKLKSLSIQMIVKQINSYDITLRRTSNINVDKEESIISLVSYKINLPSISTNLVISMILLLTPLLIILIHFKFFLKMKQGGIKTISTAYKYSSFTQKEDPWLKAFIEFWSIIDRISKIFNIDIELSDTHREVHRKISDKINDRNQYIMLSELIRYYEIARFSQFRGGIDIDLFKSRIELVKRYLL